MLLAYAYSVSSDRMFLGNGDSASRFLIAMDYARNPGMIFDLDSWTGYWPPVPFILQSSVIRLIMLSGVNDPVFLIKSVQYLSIVLVLFGFLLIARSVTIQTDRISGLFTLILCLSSMILLDIAQTPLAEIYGFFFVSAGILNMFRVIAYNKGVLLCMLSFALAYFSRTETLAIAILSAVFLFLNGRAASAVLLFVAVTLLACMQMISASLAEHGQLLERGIWGGVGFQRFEIAAEFIRSFIRANKGLIILSSVLVGPTLFLYAIHWYRSKERCEPPSASEVNKVYFQLIQSGKCHTILDSISTSFSWLIKTPLTIWVLYFLVAFGSIIALALAGAVSPIVRYLAIANVFMTVIIALLSIELARCSTINKLWISRLLSRAAIISLASLSLWNGFSHAVSDSKMPVEMSQVVNYISDKKLPGDRIAFDFLGWKHTALASYLIDPSLTIPTQYVTNKAEREYIETRIREPLNPNGTKTAVDEAKAFCHTFIQEMRPKFLVIASDKFFAIIKNEFKVNAAAGFDIDIIRKYLTKQDTSSWETVAFNSPYINQDLVYKVAFQNELFIVLRDSRQ